jgi:predicted nucleic acid-binding protein
LLSAGDVIAIALQVLAEFIHVVTDPRPFTQPLDMNVARDIAEQWWTASDVVKAFPRRWCRAAFVTWLQQFSLGRKRLLDTLLAAACHQAGIQSLLTANQSDFLVFGALTCLAFKRSGIDP